MSICGLFNGSASCYVLRQLDESGWGLNRLVSDKGMMVGCFKKFV